MLHEQTKEHITALDDWELLQYVLTGPRMYEPEAIAFAKEQLKNRNLAPEQLAAMRVPIVANLAMRDAHTLPQHTRPASAVVCENCGLEVSNRYVKYHQNVGFVMHFAKFYSGCLCKRCNRRLFWKTTLTTLSLGWWGLSSFFVAISFLLNNLIAFFRTRSLPPVPAGASRPLIDDDIIARHAPQLALINERLDEGAHVNDIAREVAPIANITPGQAWYCIQNLIQQQAHNQLPQPIVGGFPVIPIPVRRAASVEQNG